MVDATHPMMRPSRDPMRSLIYAAGDRALKAVYVDGTCVVQDGEVLTMDYRQAAAHLDEAQKRVMANAPGQDWAHRPVEKISPPTLPVVLMTDDLLRIEGLRVVFSTSSGEVAPVDGVDLAVPRGKTLGIVGGKRLRQIDAVPVGDGPGCRSRGGSPPGRVLLDGRDLAALSPAAMRKVRGGDIAMIFQDPMTSLNPVHSVGHQIIEGNAGA